MSEENGGKNNLAVELDADLRMDGKGIKDGVQGTHAQITLNVRNSNLTPEVSPGQSADVWFKVDNADTIAEE